MTTPSQYLPSDLMESLKAKDAQRLVRGITGLCDLRGGGFVNKSQCKELREDVLRVLDGQVRDMWTRRMNVVRSFSSGPVQDLYYTSIDSGPMLGAWLKRATKIIAGSGHSNDGYGQMVAELVRFVTWFTPISTDLLSKETLAKVQSGVDPAEKAVRAEKRKQAEIDSGKIVMTCGCCFRGIAFDHRDGKMHHHGYERPGHGWQTASCLGVNYGPLEHTKEGVEAIVKMIARDLARMNQRYNSRSKWPKIEVMRNVPKPGGKRWETEKKLITIMRGEADWDREYEFQVSSLKRDIDFMTMDLHQRTAVLEAWHLGMDQEEAIRVMSAATKTK